MHHRCLLSSFLSCTCKNSLFQLTFLLSCPFFSAVLSLSKDSLGLWHTCIAQLHSPPGGKVLPAGCDSLVSARGLGNIVSLAILPFPAKASPHAHILVSSSAANVSVYVQPASASPSFIPLHSTAFLLRPPDWDQQGRPITTSNLASLLINDQVMVVQAVGCDYVTSAAPGDHIESFHILASASPSPLSPQSPCSLAMQLWMVTLSSIHLYTPNVSLPHFSPIGPLVCLKEHASVCNVSVTAAVSRNASVCMGLHAVVSYQLCNASNRVYISYVCLDSASSFNSLDVSLSSQHFGAKVIPEPSAPPLLFGVGGHLRSDILEENVLLLHDNSFCWNSFSRDDNVPPRFLRNMVCDSFTEGFITEHNDPSTLAYTFGPIWVLIDRLTHATPGSLVTSACDDRLLHGTYDMGLYPTAVLLPNRVAISMHVSLHRNESGTDCGAPLSAHGQVMIDAWTLPWFLLLILSFWFTLFHF